MKNTVYLLFILGAAVCVSAVRKKGPLTLGEKVQHLTELSVRNPVVRFNGEKFRQFVATKNRNYSVVIMMTALNQLRQCHICPHANEEFKTVARSWVYSQAFTNKLFFGMVEFDEASDIFELLRINSAPVFILFPEKGDLSSKSVMDIQRVGIAAEAIASWIYEKTETKIMIIRPPSYSGSLALLILCSLIGALLYMRRNNLDFLYNRTSWALGSLSIVFAMTSGQMWNHIRGPPLMQRTQKGVTYVHGSSGGQLVIETYIIILLNGAVAFGMILMNEAVKGKGDPRKRKIMAVLGLGLTAIFFSLLLSVFRSKSHGYPYSFLFK